MFKLDFHSYAPYSGPIITDKIFTIILDKFPQKKRVKTRILSS